LTHDPFHALREFQLASGARSRKVNLRLRVETPIEIDYLRHGGILPYVLRSLLRD
jgi:aconitase A